MTESLPRLGLHVESGSSAAGPAEGACKEPGWLEAEPAVLLLPEPVRRAVLDWATGGRGAAD